MPDVQSNPYLNDFPSELPPEPLTFEVVPAWIVSPEATAEPQLTATVHRPPALLAALARLRSNIRPSLARLRWNIPPSLARRPTSTPLVVYGLIGCSALALAAFYAGRTLRVKTLALTSGSSLELVSEPAPLSAGVPVTRARSDAAPVPSLPSLYDPQLIRMEPAVSAAFSPTFSTDSRTLFFHVDEGHGSVLKRARLESERMTSLETIGDGRGRNFHARLSPDTTRMAFDSDRDGVRGVYVANADGSAIHRVSGEGYAAVPSWSPDGRSLAFVRAEDARPAVWNLWLLELASGATRRLSWFPSGQVWTGSWFPGGDQLCYSHETDLIVLSLSSGTLRTFHSPVEGHLARTPAVSPDGRRVAFQVLGDGIWILELRGGSMQRVLADPSAEEFAWSPDGARVAFHSRRDGAWRLWMLTSRVTP